VRILGALIVAGLVLSACGSVTPSVATKRWMSQSAFASARRTLIDDTVRAERVLKDPAGTASQRHTVCEVLYSDSSAAISALPTPDTQANDLLNAAYTHLGRGAQICFVAATMTLRRVAVIELNRGLANLSFATIRLGVVVGA